MLRPIFTLDYEIHGNGEGCPYRLMVEPTARMLDQFDRYGAKLTIMAEVAEIAQYGRYASEHGIDRFHYAEIVKQLEDAIRRGHDVQLHLHPSYVNARNEDGRWLQDWSEYDFARLGVERMAELVQFGKSFLENLLQRIDSSYRCHVFRAANWSVVPSCNIVRVLAENGFHIDSSVFKYGKRNKGVRFDYSNAPSALVPWRPGDEDICTKSETGRLWEFPIYSEQRWIGAFITPQRLARASLGALHRHRFAQLRDETVPGVVSYRTKQGRFWKRWRIRKHAWKADFNQCTGTQLINALGRAEAAYGRRDVHLPFILIGHSKLFSRFNEWSIRNFLEHIARRPERYQFSRFRDIDLAAVSQYWKQVEQQSLKFEPGVFRP